LRMAVLGLRCVGLPSSGSRPAATAACMVEQREMAI
jgi:hypothetical protein